MQKMDAPVKVSETAPQIEKKRLRAVVAAKRLVSWSQEGLVRSETVSVCLTGVNPTPLRKETRFGIGYTGAATGGSTVPCTWQRSPGWPVTPKPATTLRGVIPKANAGRGNPTLRPALAALSHIQKTDCTGHRQEVQGIS